MTYKRSRGVPFSATIKSVSIETLTAQGEGNNKWLMMPWTFCGTVFRNILTPEAIDILLLAHPIICDREYRILGGWRSLEILKTYYCSDEKTIFVPVIVLAKRLTAAERRQLSIGIGFITMLSTALGTEKTKAYYLGDFWTEMKDKPELDRWLSMSNKSARNFAKACGRTTSYIFRRKSRSTK